MDRCCWATCRRRHGRRQRSESIDCPSCLVQQQQQNILNQNHADEGGPAVGSIRAAVKCLTSFRPDRLIAPEVKNERETTYAIGFHRRDARLPLEHRRPALDRPARMQFQFRMNLRAARWMPRHRGAAAAGDDVGAVGRRGRPLPESHLLGGRRWRLGQWLAAGRVAMVALLLLGIRRR